MEIQVNEYGHLLKVNDSQFISHASGWAVNVIDLYFKPTESVQEVSQVNFAVIRPDGIPILNLPATLTAVAQDSPKYEWGTLYRYTIRDEDGVLGVHGSLSISAQILHIDTADGVTTKEVIATCQTSATILQNIGIEDTTEYNAVATALNNLTEQLSALGNRVSALEALHE